MMSPAERPFIWLTEMSTLIFPGVVSAVRTTIVRAGHIRESVDMNRTLSRSCARLVFYDSPSRVTNLMIGTLALGITATVSVIFARRTD